MEPNFLRALWGYGKNLCLLAVSLPRRMGIALIALYQHTLSPDHSWLRHYFPGGYCRFTPSCSDYTKEAIRTYGLLRGSLKGLWRIFRCNPCSRGGLDLP